MLHSAQQTLSEKDRTIKVKYHSTTSTLTKPAASRKNFRLRTRQNQLHVYNSLLISHQRPLLTSFRPPHPYLKYLLLLAGLTLALLVGLIIFACSFLAALNSTLESLKPAALRSQFNLQFESALTVSLCKLFLFSDTIFRTKEKLLLIHAFERGMHKSDFINAARLLKILLPSHNC